MRRLLFAILLVLALLAVPVAAIAQTYIISVQLTESGGSTYAEGAWTLFVNNAYLASTGQESSTGLDTQFLLGGVTLPEMVADNRTTFACPLSARTTSNLQYTLGNALASSFNVILGYNGSITTLASTTLNIGGAGSVNETGYFDPTLSATLLSIPTANGTFAIQGDGSAVRGFLHARDTAEAFACILEKGELGEIYNIGTEDEYSILEIARILIRMIHKTEAYDDWVSYIEDRPFNDQRYYISNAKLKALGWEVKTDLQTGLRDLTKNQ